MAPKDTENEEIASDLLIEINEMRQSYRNKLSVSLSALSLLDHVLWDIFEKRGNAEDRQRIHDVLEAILYMPNFIEEMNK